MATATYIRTLHDENGLVQKFYGLVPALEGNSFLVVSCFTDEDGKQESAAFYSDDPDREHGVNILDVINARVKEAPVHDVDIDGYLGLLGYTADA